MAWTSGDMFSGGASEVKVNNRDVGGTMDGVRIRRETDWLDFEIDQVKFKVRKEAILSSMFVETVLAEPNLWNVAMAWSMNSTTALTTSSSLELIEPDGTEEVTFEATGPTMTASARGGGSDRVYYFPRCVALANGEYNLNRGVQTSVPLNLEVLADSTASPVSFGFFYDV